MNRTLWIWLGYHGGSSRGRFKYWVRRAVSDKYIQVFLGKPKKPEKKSDGVATSGWVYAHCLLAYIMTGDSSVFHGTKRQGKFHVTMHSRTCESKKAKGCCLNPHCLGVGTQADNVRTMYDRKIKWSEVTDKARFACQRRRRNRSK